MATKNILESATENENWNDFIKVVESFFKKSGYEKVKSCECKEKPSKTEVKKLQEKAKDYSNRFHQQYEPRDNERLYTAHVSCLHYGDPNEQEGVILMIEGHEETRGNILQIFKGGFRKGIEFGKISKKQNTGALGVIKMTNQERKNISHDVKRGIELGIISCYAYGDKYTGRKEKLDFECQKGRNWGEILEIPTVIKSVSLSQIQELCSSEL